MTDTDPPLPRFSPAVDHGGTSVPTLECWSDPLAARVFAQSRARAWSDPSRLRAASPFAERRLLILPWNSASSPGMNRGSIELEGGGWVVVVVGGGGSGLAAGAGAGAGNDATAIVVDVVLVVVTVSTTSSMSSNSSSRTPGTSARSSGKTKMVVEVVVVALATAAKTWAGNSRRAGLDGSLRTTRASVAVRVSAMGSAIKWGRRKGVQRGRLRGT